MGQGRVVSQPCIKAWTCDCKNGSGSKRVWATQADKECFHMLTKKMADTRL